MEVNSLSLLGQGDTRSDFLNFKKRKLHHEKKSRNRTCLLPLPFKDKDILYIEKTTSDTLKNVGKVKGLCFVLSLRLWQ